jgi:hypothetical protein
LVIRFGYFWNDFGEGKREQGGKRICRERSATVGVATYSKRSFAQDNLFFESRAPHGSQKINCPNALGDRYMMLD